MHPLLTLGTAFAGDLGFTPDRPGVGDSTGTVAPGHLMVEGSIGGSLTAPSIQAAGWVGRIGIDQGLEARLRLPDLGYADGLVVGPVGIGAKLASPGERWSISVVPELLLDPRNGGLSGSIGTNLSLAIGRLGAWAHGSALLYPGGLDVFVGGGASLSFDRLGLFLNGGYTAGATGLLGVGGWLPLREAMQLDLGIDLLGIGGEPSPTLTLGWSAGW